MLYVPCGAVFYVFLVPWVWAMVIPGMGKKAAGGGDREDVDTGMDGLHMILQNITYCCPGEMLLLSSIWCCLDFAHFGPPISPATWIPYGFQIPSTQWRGPRQETTNCHCEFWPLQAQKVGTPQGEKGMMDQDGPGWGCNHFYVGIQSHQEDLRRKYK